MRACTLFGVLACLAPAASAQLLTAEPAALSFSYELGTAAPARQTVKIDSSLFGVRLSPPEISAGSGWLSATLAFQSTPDTLNVAVNPFDLAPGKYQGTVTVTSPSAPSVLTKTIPVDLAVGSTLSLQHQLGFNPAAPVCITVAGAPGFSFAISSGPPAWLVAAVDPSSPRRLCVSVNPAGLSPGAFSGRITVNGSSVIAVNVTVIGPPTVAVSVSALSFTQQLGAAGAPAPQVISISSERPAAGVRFTSSTLGGAWLKAEADSDVTPGRVTVSVDPAGLAPGRYEGAVALTFGIVGADPLPIPVTLTVLGLNFSVSPGSLTFQYETGAPARSQTLAVAARGAAGESLPWTFQASASESWLVVTPADGTTPGSVTVSLNAASLPKGTYTATVTITGPQVANSPQTIPVTLRIVDPSLGVSVSRLDFTWRSGTALPPGKSIDVSSSSTVLNFTATVSTESGVNWLAVTPGSGLRTPQTVSVAVTRPDLAPGVYSATITITAPAASNSTFTIPVTVNVRAKPVLQVRPAALTFLQQLGADPVGDQILRVAGDGSDLQITGALMYRGVNYLTVDSTGATPAFLTVSIDTTSLPPGTYTGAIRINSPGTANAPLSVPVTVVVKEAPIVSVIPSGLAFTYLMGGNTPEAQILRVFGSAPVAFNAAPTPGTGWMTVTPPRGFTAAVNGDTGDFSLTGSRLNIAINAKGMAEGVYTSSIVIEADDTSIDRVTVPVTLTVRKNLLTLPQISDGSGSSTSMAVVSTDLEPAPFVMNFWAPDGRPLSLALQGLGDRLTLTGSAPSPGLQFVDTVGAGDRPVQGWAELSGQKAIAASAVFRQRLSSSADAEAALAFWGAGLQRFVVPFDNTLGYATGVAIVNRASTAAVAAVTIRNEDGRQLAADTLRIEARSQKTVLFPTQFPATANRRGSIEFVAAAGELYAAGFRNSARGLSTAWNVPAPAADSATRFVPFVADGQGWTTSIVLVNTGTDAAPVSVAFGGSALPIGGGDAVEEYFDLIPAGGMRILRTDGASANRSITWAEIVGGRQVMAMAIVREPGDIEAEAAVPAESAATNHFYLPFDNTQGVETTFGLVNPSTADTGTARLSYRDENGLTLATDTINVDPWTSLVITLPASYASLFNRRGVVDVRLTGLDMFGVRTSSHGALTFLPLLPR